MASVIFGGGVTNIVGSHAGNTFAHNKGGSYVKKKTHGTNPRSGLQSAHRTTVGRLAKHYTFTLSDAQRSAWRTFASTTPVINRMGNTAFLSGQQMFAKVSAQLLAGGFAIINTPPASGAVGTPTGVTIAAVHGGGGSLTITNFIAGAGANDKVIVYCSPPMNPGRAFISSQLRRLPTLNAVNAAVINTADYLTSYGILPTSAGQRIFVRIAVVNTTTGITSAIFQGSDLWT